MDSPQQFIGSEMRDSYFPGAEGKDVTSLSVPLHLVSESRVILTPIFRPALGIF